MPPRWTLCSSPSTARKSMLVRNRAHPSASSRLWRDCAQDSLMRRVLRQAQDERMRFEESRIRQLYIKLGKFQTELIRKSNADYRFDEIALQ